MSNVARIKNYQVMKFTVEVEDFWIEEEELSTSLKNAVKNDVISQIRTNIKEQVDVFMNKHIVNVLNKEIETRVKVLMEDFLAIGKVKDRYSSTTDLTISEFLAKNFESNNNNILEYIKKVSTAQATEIKQRYDLLFASQIVAKINEQGLLKEDVAKLLLPQA